MTFCPVTCWTMADNMYVAALLYMNVVPGGWSMGQPRKVFTQLSVCTIGNVGSLGQPRKVFTQLSVCTIGNVGSFALPTDIVSRSLTRNAARCSLTGWGRSCGKSDSPRSSTRSLPTATAKPTAVEVKLLLREYRV